MDDNLIEPFVIKEVERQIELFTIGGQQEVERQIEPFTIGGQQEVERQIEPFTIGGQQEVERQIEPFTIGEQQEVESYIMPFTVGEQRDEGAEMEAVCIDKKRELILPTTCEQANERTLVRKIENSNIKEEQNVKSENMQTNILKNVRPSNYDIMPIHKTIYIDRNGEKVYEKEKIHCKILIRGHAIEEFEVLTVDLQNLARIVGRRFSSAAVDYSVPHAEKLIESEFREKTTRLPIHYCFIQYGWQKIHGRWVYLHDSYKGEVGGTVETGLNLPIYTYTKVDVRRVFDFSLQLYGLKSSMSTMLLFSLMGVAYKLFMEAGYAPHFLLFLNGRSGSMKTTIGKILFIQLADESHRDYPRRIDADTVVSFERALVTKGRDTVTLIDDYAPAKTAQKKVELQNKLESIIRMVGDGSTKSRSNASLEDVQGEGVRGAVVLTGELRGKGVSSNLRCLYCEMQREYVNTEMVTWFQENPYAYTTFVAWFADYLAGNWERAIKFIKSEFPVGRKRVGEELKERRLVDSVVMLHVLGDFLRDFFISVCNADKQEMDAIIYDMKKQVLVNAGVSESLSTEESPAVHFVKGLDNLMCQGNIMILAKEDFLDKVDADGFMDDKFFYFLPERVFDKVQKLFRMGNEYFCLDLHELVTCLYDEKIIKTYANGIGKRTYYSRIPLKNGKKQKFLKISREIFDAIAEDKM